jgi:hypothetical protein
MNGQDFMRITNAAFMPFLTKLGFELDEPSVSGRYYRTSFTDSSHAVSVSYEPGDNALFVIVFSKNNGELSDIDDPTKTLRLADLNSRYMSAVRADERAENEAFFRSIEAKNGEERAVLKAAKELRLVLPRYLDNSKGGARPTA